MTPKSIGSPPPHRGPGAVCGNRLDRCAVEVLFNRGRQGLAVDVRLPPHEPPRVQNRRRRVHERTSDFVSGGGGVSPRSHREYLSLSGARPKYQGSLLKSTRASSLAIGCSLGLSIGRASVSEIRPRQRSRWPASPRRGCRDPADGSDRRALAPITTRIIAGKAEPERLDGVRGQVRPIKRAPRHHGKAHGTGPRHGNDEGHPANRERDVCEDAERDGASQPAHPGRTASPRLVIPARIRQDQSQHQEITGTTARFPRPGDQQGMAGQANTRADCRNVPNHLPIKIERVERESPARRRGCRVPAPRPSWWRRSRSGAIDPTRPGTCSSSRSIARLVAACGKDHHRQHDPENSQARVPQPDDATATPMAAIGATHATGRGCRQATDGEGAAAMPGGKAGTRTSPGLGRGLGRPASRPPRESARSPGPRAEPERPRQMARNPRYVAQPTLPGTCRRDGEIIRVGAQNPFPETIATVQRGMGWRDACGGETPRGRPQSGMHQPENQDQIGQHKHFVGFSRPRPTGSRPATAQHAQPIAVRNEPKRAVGSIPPSSSPGP